MTPGDRLKAWVDDLSLAWKDRLRGWMASWVVKGIDELIAEKEPEIIGLTKDTLDKLKATPNIPPELAAMLEKATTTGDIFSAIAGWMMTLIGALPAMLGLGAPLGRSWEYTQERVIKSYRLDALAITRIWLRDKAEWEIAFDDLRDQGWTEQRIDIAKELAKIIPPLADMVRFADFSAFDPEVIAKWREFYDAPGWITAPMSLIGVFNEAPRDWANKYWFSHWRQPGRFEIGDVYRRGLLGEPLVGKEEVGGPGGEGEAEGLVKLAYRTMGYSPFWQDKLLQLVREIPTRVDVRRWWDMRTIDEAELRSIYQRRGYLGKDLENYVLWTKVYVAFPDLIARWKNGWITIDDVRAELTGYGMPAARVEELIETKIKASQPERTASERDLTKTDIVMGVKKGIITTGEGLELLMDLGYDSDEAEFVLDVRIAAVTGSPENFEEFKDLTSKWRKSAGMITGPEAEGIKQAAAEVVKLTRDLELLQTRIKEEEAILVREEILPPAATAKRDELRVSLHRAESALAAARDHYDTLVAEWRHKA